MVQKISRVPCSFTPKITPSLHIVSASITRVLVPSGSSTKKNRQHTSRKIIRSNIYSLKWRSKQRNASRFVAITTLNWIAMHLVVTAELDKCAEWKIFSSHHVSTDIRQALGYYETLEHLSNKIKRQVVIPITHHVLSLLQKFFHKTL